MINGARAEKGGSKRDLHAFLQLQRLAPQCRTGLLTVVEWSLRFANATFACFGPVLLYNYMMCNAR